MILKGNCRRILFRELEGDQYFIKTIRQNSVKHFLDIGANVGLISIMARLLHPKMDIVSVEPHSIVYSRLQENIRNLRIGCLHSALGNGQTMYLQKDRKSHVCNEFTNEKSDSSSMSINSLTLYEMINKCRFNPSDLMLKVDVEGAEEFILEDDNSKKCLTQCKVFSAELHDKGKTTLDYKIEGFYNLLKKTHTVRIETHKLANIVAVRKDFLNGGLA